MERYKRVVVIKQGERFVNLNTRLRAIGYTADEAVEILERLKERKDVVEIRIGIEPCAIAYECVRGITIQAPSVKANIKGKGKREKAA